jgi:hypothetical protein
MLFLTLRKSLCHPFKIRTAATVEVSCKCWLKFDCGLAFQSPEYG